MANASPYHHLYNTTRWRKRRAEHLQYNPLCVMCIEEGKTRLGSIADHKTPHRGDLDLFFEGELQTLCPSHHSSVKQSMESGKTRRGSHADGSPLDPNHPWYQG